MGAFGNWGFFILALWLVFASDPFGDLGRLWQGWSVVLVAAKLPMMAILTLFTLLSTPLALSVIIAPNGVSRTILSGRAAEIVPSFWWCGASSRAAVRWALATLRHRLVTRLLSMMCAFDQWLRSHSAVPNAPPEAAASGDAAAEQPQAPSDVWEELLGLLPDGSMQGDLWEDLANRDKSGRVVPNRAWLMSQVVRSLLVYGDYGALVKAVGILGAGVQRAGAARLASGSGLATTWLSETAASWSVVNEFAPSEDLTEVERRLLGRLPIRFDDRDLGYLGGTVSQASLSEILDKLQRKKALMRVQNGYALTLRGIHALTNPPKSPPRHWAV